MRGIFVSYRRADAIDIAGRICDRLKSAFVGEKEVFMDVGAISPGTVFPTSIDRKLRTSDAIVAVIGNHWGSASVDAGLSESMLLGDRCDWVRRELETALECQIPIFPVLVHGASMPEAEKLPELVRPLVSYQATKVSSGSNFEDQVKGLIEGIRNRISFECIETASKPVISIDMSDCLSKVMGFVHEEDFSQFPVCHGETFMGLLTENGITQWLASRCKGNANVEIDLETTKVQEVVRFQEDMKSGDSWKLPNYRFITSRLVLDEAMHLFYENPALEALLLTDDGNPGIQIKGIITQWDALEFNKKKSRSD